MLNQSDSLRTINGATVITGIIGMPLTDSLSPVFWNRAFAAKELNAAYLPFPTQLPDLKAVITGLKKAGIRGINVTAPLKSGAAKLCQKLYGAAAELKIVNTIIFSGTVEGWNTDATGLKKIIAAFIHENSTVLILGNGASAGSAVWALKNSGCHNISIIARNPDHQVAFLKQHKDITKLDWNNKNLASGVAKSDIIINATPLGRKSEDFVSELEEYLDQNKIYVDLNYVPFSKLLASARKSGCMVVDGRELLLKQGLESFRIIMQTNPPEQLIKDCIYK